MHWFVVLQTVPHQRRAGLPGSANASLNERSKRVASSCHLPNSLPIAALSISIATSVFDSLERGPGSLSR